MQAPSKIAVIVAGGSGTRMQSATPKQFMMLGNKPVLQYTLDTFLSAYDDLNVVLVLPENGSSPEWVNEWEMHSRITITHGGPTRFHSVSNGLAYAKKDDVIFVHDAVRCLLTTNLIHRCYAQASALGSAIPAIPSRDSIRMVDGNSSRVVNRNLIRLIQTPQTFLGEILLPAFQQPYSEEFTDEASVVEAYGTRVHLIEGEERNIKITVPEDFYYAKALLGITASASI